MSKAQVAVEYMAVVAISLFALFLIWSYVSSVRQSVDHEVRIGLAQEAVERLAQSIRLVSVQGPPARLFVEVNNPQGVTAARPNSSVGCNASEVMLVVPNLQGYATEIYRFVPVNVSGDLSFLVGSAGPKRIAVEAVVLNGVPCVVLSG